MPKKAKPEMLGKGIAAKAGKTMKGRKAALEAAEAAAMGNTWGKGVKRNK